MLRRLTHLVRRADAACDARASLVGSLMLGAVFVGLLIFGVRASEFVDMPAGAPQAGEDGFPWFTAIFATLFAAVALWGALTAFTEDAPKWLVGDDPNDGLDYRDAESRGAPRDAG